MKIQSAYNLTLNIPVLNTFSFTKALLLNKLSLRQLEGLNEFYVFMDNYTGTDPEGDIYNIFLIDGEEVIIPSSYINHDTVKEIITFRRRSPIVSLIDKMAKPLGYKLVKR